MMSSHFARGAALPSVDRYVRSALLQAISLAATAWTSLGAGRHELPSAGTPPGGTRPAAPADSVGWRSGGQARGCSESGGGVSAPVI